MRPSAHHKPKMITETIMGDMSFLHDDEKAAMRREMEDERELKDFDDYRERHRFRLKKGDTSTGVAPITKPVHVDHAVDAIRKTMKFVIHSTHFLNLQARRFIKAVHVLQRVTRRFLWILRRRTKTIQARWRREETEARQRIRTELTLRLQLSSNQHTLRAVQQLWLCYMDCWVPRELMQPAIMQLWRDRKLAIVHKIRAENAGRRRKKKLHHRGDEGKRREILEWFSDKTVSTIELCAHLDLIYKDRNVFKRSDGRQILSQIIKRQRERVLAFKMQNIPSIGNVDDLQAPVSYYHALLLFCGKQLYFVVFLRLLVNGDRIGVNEVMPMAMQLQLKQARKTFDRWDTTTMALPPQRGLARYTIGADGQPVSGYRKYRLPNELQYSSLTRLISHYSPPASPKGGKGKGDSKGDATHFDLPLVDSNEFDLPLDDVSEWKANAPPTPPHEMITRCDTQPGHLTDVPAPKPPIPVFKRRGTKKLDLTEKVQIYNDFLQSDDTQAAAEIDVKEAWRCAKAQFDKRRMKLGAVLAVRTARDLRANSPPSGAKAAPPPPAMLPAARPVNVNYHIATPAAGGEGPSTSGRASPRQPAPSAHRCPASASVSRAPPASPPTPRLVPRPPAQVSITQPHDVDLDCIVRSRSLKGFFETPVRNRFSPRQPQAAGRPSPRQQ